MFISRHFIRWDPLSNLARSVLFCHRPASPGPLVLHIERKESEINCRWQHQNLDLFYLFVKLIALGRLSIMKKESEEIFLQLVMNLLSPHWWIHYDQVDCFISYLDWCLALALGVKWNKQSCLLAGQVRSPTLSRQHTPLQAPCKDLEVIYIYSKVLTTYFMNKIASPILSNIFLLCSFILSGFMLIPLQC